jgi:predicted helicase
MVGVGITVAIRSQAHQERRLFYHCVPNTWTRAEKLGFLTEHVELQGRQNSLNTIAWQTLQPDTRHTWLVPENVEEFEAYLPIGSKEGKAAKTKISETIFNLYSLGVVTSRDSLVYGFDSQLIEANAQVFIEIYNRAVDIMRRPGRNIDPISLIDTKNPRIKWTRQVKRSLEQKLYSEFSQKHIRISLYRPFTKKKLYFDDFWNEERYQQHRFFPTPASEAENRVIITSDIGYRARTFSCLMSNAIPDLHLCASVDAHQCFPFYVYEPDPTPNPSPNTGRGFVRRENITDWALARFRAHYGGVLIEKWDIFYYIYALLHHPTYRARFADNLKRELPRIPMIGGPAEFAALSAAGRALADLHLNYEAGPEFELIWTAKEGAQLDWRVQKMRLTPDKTGIIYNETFTAGGIPPEAFGYKLGNRSALEWVLDQYQVTEDKGSGIISDPNNPDDPEYIRRLIGQVIHVSLKTLEITAALPNF